MTATRSSSRGPSPCCPPQPHRTQCNYCLPFETSLLFLLTPWFLRRGSYACSPMYWLRRRWRKLRHQPDGCAQFLELKVRSQEDYRCVGARLSRDFRHVHSSFPQRELGLELLAGVVLRENVVSDPAIQVRRNVIGSHEASDFVSHDRLQIMGESRGSKDIGEHGRDPGIRVGLVGVVLSRLLGRLAREECRVVRALAMTQGCQTQSI